MKALPNIQLTQLNALIKTLNKHQNKDNAGIVGIIGGGKTRKDGLSNIQLATIHEFGVPEKRIPRRSFLVDTVNFKEKIIQEDLQILYQMFVKSKITKPMAKFLLKVRAYVDEAFSSSGFGKWQPNTPRTIEKKKSDRPLIDTGFLADSIDTKTFKSK